MGASELKDVFQERNWEWNDYKKFCFVRNPFDRVVSLFHHRSRTHETTFDNFVKTVDPENRVTTSLEAFLCDKNGEFLVDDILKFEELSDVLPKFLTDAGISITSADIPHLNGSDDRLGYREYYNDELVETVSNLYKYEIERFDYSF